MAGISGEVKIVAKFRQSASRQRTWLVHEKPIVLAHRAGGNEAPENSLTAFAKMEQLGFRYIETDSHATKDGVVILFHDPILDRTTNGHGKVSSHNWVDFAQIHDDSGNTPLRLDLVLEKYPNLVLNIDAKNWHVVAPLVRVIRKRQAMQQVSLAAFSETRLKVLRHLLPGVATSLGQGAIATLVLLSRLPKRIQPFFDWLVPGVERGAQAVQVPAALAKIPVVTKRFIHLCHRRGQAVQVWTINDPDEMRRLLALGVDAIITDEPSLARRVIEQFCADRR